MSLTLQLGCVEQGDKLVEIVESSMRKLKGWKVQKQRGKRPFYILVKEEGCYYMALHAWPPQSGAGFDVPVNSGKKNDDILLCLKRYCGRGRIAASGFVSFNPIKMAIALPFALMDKWRGVTLFTTNDSIFTFINPHQPYSKLVFYANAAFDPANPTGGRVEHEGSPQFRKIRPAYDLLVENITRTIPASHPYRGISQNG